MTEAGGGVVFSQAAHQVDVVRLLSGSRAVRVRSILGAWDPARPTEGAYSALVWFEDGAYASLSYNGYAHFDSDEWCDWAGELGSPKDPNVYGQVRKRLGAIASAAEEAKLKAAGTYGGTAYKPAASTASVVAGSIPARQHQHFGPIIVSCERGDVRPMADAIWIYGNERRERRALSAALVPRFEVIDELYTALVEGKAPTHDGPWARATLEICLAFLQSDRAGGDVALVHQVAHQVARSVAH